MGGAVEVRAVGEFADDFDRALEGVDAVDAMIADVERPFDRGRRRPVRP